MKSEVLDKSGSKILESNLISRDLSWIKFNQRVLDQAKSAKRNIFERLKFIAITASNLDEFFMIRVGSLYNYLDFNKKRIDYSGLREIPFKKKLLTESQNFFYNQNHYFTNTLAPLFKENGFSIRRYDELSTEHKQELDMFFSNTIYPMLTPMLFDSYHPFPLLTNMRLFFGVVTRKPKESKKFRKLSFIQVPRNLPRFYEFESEDMVVFVPIEDIIRNNIDRFFKNVDILSVNLFRLSRNSDFTLEESEDIEMNFLEELKMKLKTRRTGRVVRFEVQGEEDHWFLDQVKERWQIDDYNIFRAPENSLMDFTSLWQIVNHTHFKDRQPDQRTPALPLSFPLQNRGEDIFEILKERDIMLHHPYNTMEPFLNLLEKSAEDPNVLAIKMTLYRVAKESRVTSALLNAAENGKHVSVLFEVKARFDEENNLREAEILQKAGCFVIYGVSNLKTHTKLCLIVRNEGDKVQRYVHMATGNYNEVTSKLYTDIGVLSSNDKYANDVSEFFNVITGHSLPSSYENLMTAPRYMRDKLLVKIQREAENARKGLPSGIVIKVNSLQDKITIDALYKASQAGVIIKLIIRGICCLRPGRAGLSENISVCSIVGDYLEHSRIYYFQNGGEPEVYIGSADAMVRSFDRRLESLFSVEDDRNKQEAINILDYNLKDNVNSYIMTEDGNYYLKDSDGHEPFNVHERFFKVTRSIIKEARLF